MAKMQVCSGNDGKIFPHCIAPFPIIRHFATVCEKNGKKS
jgi:hypothetical protein